MIWQWKSTIVKKIKKKNKKNEEIIFTVTSFQLYDARITIY
jgi:hypothetical protein